MEEQIVQNRLKWPGYQLIVIMDSFFMLEVIIIQINRINSYLNDIEKQITIYNNWEIYCGLLTCIALCHILPGEIVQASIYYNDFI